MKQLKKNGQYPPELWEDTAAPAWSEERVWERMMVLQDTPKAGPNYGKWGGGALFLLLVGVLFYVVVTAQSPKLGAFPIGQSEVVLVEEPVGLKLTESEVSIAKKPILILHSPKAEIKAADTKFPADLGIEPRRADTLQQTLPVATYLPVSEPLPVLMTSPVEQPITALPAGSRPGTKLTFRLPELPAEDLNPTYSKRLWAQFKRLQNKGEIDWEELGIERNADGTFSVITPAKKATEQQDN